MLWISDFKYENDSVLVVGYWDYVNCTTWNAISEFDDGNTVFEFNPSGFFYFISGQPDHCTVGQKMIIRVMHPSKYKPGRLLHPPESAPSPGVHDYDAHNDALLFFKSVKKIPSKSFN